MTRAGAGLIVESQLILGLMLGDIESEVVQIVILLKYVGRQVLWSRLYPHGILSLAVLLVLTGCWNGQGDKMTDLKPPVAEQVPRTLVVNGLQRQDASSHRHKRHVSPHPPSDALWQNTEWSKRSRQYVWMFVRHCDPKTTASPIETSLLSQSRRVR